MISGILSESKFRLFEMLLEAAAGVAGDAARAVLPKFKKSLVCACVTAKFFSSIEPAVDTTPLEKSVIELTTYLAASATSGEKDIFC